MQLPSSFKRIARNVPTCHSSQEISEVRDYLQKNAGRFDTINYVYAVTKKGKLKGVISIKELFRKPGNSLVRDSAVTKVVKAHPGMDREKIAHMALRHGIKAVPVVDKNNNFLGVVPSDAILHILDSETREDFMLMTGIIPSDAIQQERLPVLKSFLHRSPWIVLGLFGGLLAARIISSFESVLEKEVMLAAFIPLVAYIANAVGAQTQVLYIRDLATSQKIAMLKYSLKQLLVSFFIGIACWAVIGAISLIAWQDSLLGIVVGFAVFCSIIVATIFALGIPFLLVKFRKDPAIGSGPFTTIIQDMLSVVIYFSIATVLI